MDNNSPIGWSQLRTSLNVRGTLFPTTQEQLDEYEAQRGLKLPSSYRAFCCDLGPGELASWYRFAAPGYAGSQREQWNLAKAEAFRKERTEWEEYAEDVAQFRRSIIFCYDGSPALYLMDPAVVTVLEEHEYGVFAVWRDWSTEKICDTFAQFIAICMHRGTRTLYDDPPEMSFEAPWQDTPMWPERKAKKAQMKK